jgi:histidyl-tRNA synthetase
VGGDRITGVGFAMGDVIIELLLERAGKRPELPLTPSQVLVTLFDEKLYAPTVALAGRLRQAGLNVEQFLEPIRLGKQLRYADRKEIPCVIILGPDEVAAGQVVLKDMASGEQASYTEAALIAHLHDLV